MCLNLGIFHCSTWSGRLKDIRMNHQNFTTQAFPLEVLKTRNFHLLSIRKLFAAAHGL
jgi:hypothetical protein